MQMRVDSSEVMRPTRYNIDPSALARSSSVISSSDDGHDSKMRISDSEYGYGFDDFRVEERKPKKIWRR